MDFDQPAVAALACAECGVVLPPGVTVCDRCSPRSPVTLKEASPVESLLRRAKGQLIVGALFAPMIFAPLALHNAIKAERVLRESAIPDAGLVASAQRLRIGATAVVVLVYGVLLLFALKSP